MIYNNYRKRGNKRMNEKEYKMYLRAENNLKNLEKRLNGKPIPESIKLGVERRKEILENFKGLGI